MKQRNRSEMLDMSAEKPPSSAELVPLSLPSLLVPATAALVGLYALVGVVLITAAELGGVDLEWAVGAGVFLVILQFAIGPFVLDFMLGRLYRMRWLSTSEVPPHLLAFVERVCGERKMRIPRIGLIDDGAPQAFTYGHTPSNARVVISRGVLELLDEEEVEAVVAHEIGHAVHWDMVMMTAAQMAPLILYYIYRSLVDRTREEGQDNDDGPDVSALVAIGAFVLYITSEYVVLWFSRTREYHADRFAGEVTGDPSLLARALTKIAYGLAGREKPAGEDSRREGEKAPARTPKLAAVGALGIFDGRAATSLAIAGQSAGIHTGGVNKDNLRGAMRWDLWNPWAQWYELNSTHPLVANRLRYLSSQAMHMGREPFLSFQEVRPESYWDEFLVDFAIYLLPIAVLVGAPLIIGATVGFQGTAGVMAGAALTSFGVALLIKYAFTYRGRSFPKMSVAALLGRVKVSGVRPVPCTVRGTVIGRGIPGYLFSEDFVMKDDTGIIFLDLRQPLRIWEALFGLLKAGTYEGKEVIVEGWYRRAPVPFVEIRTIRCEGGLRRSWMPVLYRLSALVLIVLGIGVGWVPDEIWTWVAEYCDVYFLGAECG